MVDYGWIANLILDCDDDNFKSMFLKLKQYIRFYDWDKDEYDADYLIEKVCDSMEKIRIYNKSNNYWDLYQNYFTTLNKIVEGKVSKNGRAFKFYKRALEISQSNSFSLDDFTDYTRIMLCLITHIQDLKDGYVIIDNSFFIDYLDESSLDFLLENIIKDFDRNNKYDFYLYHKDRFICVYIILIYYSLKSNNVVNTEVLL